jgi:glycosyltransferase involved in cell wall biosynthesis
MNVATVSIIRDGLGYLERFTAQLAGLRDALAADGHTLRSIVVEGDSTDGTWPALSGAFARHGLTADLSQHAHGGPAFPSIEHPQRWAQVSAVYNAALARLTAADDWVLHVEADLLWAPATLATLLAYLRDYDAVTPMVYYGAYGPFYDTFGFRSLSGARFLPHPPYHPDGTMTGLTELSAAGNCVAVRGQYARAAQWSPVDASVGWWAAMRAAGARLYVEPMVQVVHP